MLILVGAEDALIGRAGARDLLRRLQAGGFPTPNVRVDVVDSSPGFVADHIAPLRNSPEARAAFWRPADLLLVGLSR